MNLVFIRTGLTNACYYKFMHQPPDRKTKRIRGFDYSESGSYFITICTNESKHYFGKIESRRMILNAPGCMIYDVWRKMSKQFCEFVPQEFIVMPNHIHGIIEIRKNIIKQSEHSTVGTHTCDRPYPLGNSSSTDEHKVHPYGTRRGSLGRMVQAFKSQTTLEYIRNVKANSWRSFPGKLWQSNYYEHIIRDENDYGKIAGYIINNPLQWDMDENNR